MEKFRYYLQEVSKSVSNGIVGYIKATVKLALLGFFILCVGLWFLHIDYWLPIAFFISLVDIVPVVGSGMVMIPWILFNFFMGNTTLAWQLAVLYIVLVVVRQIAEPLLTGKAIGIRPIYTFFASIICAIIFGPFGAILGAVIAIILKSIFEVYRYQGRNSL